MSKRNYRVKQPCINIRILQFIKKTKQISNYQFSCVLNLFPPKISRSDVADCMIKLIPDKKSIHKRLVVRK